MLRSQRFIATLCVIALLYSARPVCAAVTAEDVDASIQRATAALLNSLGKSNVGDDALTVLALLHAGVPADNPQLARRIRAIVAQASSIGDDYTGTYCAGIVNMMLAELHDPDYDYTVGIIARQLLRLQQRNGSWGDNSRTQFALLGLKAARDLGVKVPTEAFHRAQMFVETGQSDAGGWGYYPHSPPGYNAMTAAGLSSLYIVTEDARKSCPVCGALDKDYRLRAGLDFLGTKLNLEKPRASYHYYYLYSLERVGVLLGQRYIGGQDWYAKGAEFLLSRQNGSTWTDEDHATEFALLFLAKGRTPAVINKLNYGDDWNPDPYDATEVAAQAGRDLKTLMSAQVLTTDAKQEDLNSAPILYLQGRKAFEFTPAFRTKLKSFVDQGGFIVASACCGGLEGFDASFRAEMKALFPDSPLEPLADSHEIFSIHHAIEKPKSFNLLGINVSCHVAVFYAPHDLCCAWSGCQGCLDIFSRKGQARELGVNLIAYALTFTQLKTRLPSTVAAKKARDATEQTPARGALVIGQIVHDGDWNPDPRAIANLAVTLKEQTGMKGDVGRRAVVLGETDLSDFPILYLTGHRKFLLTPSAEAALRAYLDNGGFLFCDACCGRAEFDASLRALCDRLCPHEPLKRIVATHPILSEPYAITSVEYKPAVASLFPNVHNAPYLEGIADKEGRLKLVYSRFNLGCELQGHACESCLGVRGKDAYRIAVNTVLYALAH